MTQIQKFWTRDSEISKFEVGNPTTIFGWHWNLGTIKASKHKVATLASCSKPITVKAMRSFIGGYKILSRVLPQCAKYIKPLDESTISLQSSDSIKWTDELSASFRQAQDGLHNCKSIVLPKASDQLWIVTNGSVKMHGIGATLYAI